MIFETWTFDSVKFLAIKRPSECYTIVDESGNNYGTFMTVESFRTDQQTVQRAASGRKNVGDLARAERMTTPVGKVRILTQIVD